MGTYQNPPHNPPLQLNFRQDQFESLYVQRIKETPFSYSELYSLNPPIFIDPFGNRLSQLIHPRMSTQQFFPPEQVIKIMECVISGLVELEENGYSAHGDICGDTVYYDKRQKIFKINHPVFSKKSGFQLTEKGLRFSFLSPEQLLILTQQNNQPLQQSTIKTSLKSDLFTLGILMCEVCTLSSSSDIYCPDTYNIFDLQIQNRLELVKEIYGGQENAKSCFVIVSMLKELLEYDQMSRKGPREMKNLLESLRNKSEMIQMGREPVTRDTTGQISRMKYVGSPRANQY